MAVVNNWRYVETFDDWMRMIEKRLMHEERRPSISTAADLMGPGLGPHAVEVRDWNNDVTKFNGIFFSEPGSINSPNDNKAWIGESQVTDAGYGVQIVWDYRSGETPPQMMLRTLDPTTGFGAWTQGGGGGGGGGANLRVEDENVGVAEDVWMLDFHGAGVEVTPGVSGEAVITIPGGGGGFGGIVWGPWQNVSRNALWSAGTIRYRRSLDGSLVQLDCSDMSLAAATTGTSAASGNITDQPICQLPPDAYPDTNALVTFTLAHGGLYSLMCAVNPAGLVSVYATTLNEGTNVASSHQGDGSVVYAAPTSGGPGGGGTITVQDENTNVVTGATVLDFQGSGVVVTPGGPGESIVTITGGTNAYTFTQGTPVSVWTIDHPLAFTPNVTVVDSSGRQVEGDVVYTDVDTITINFTAAFSGKAYLT